MKFFITVLQQDKQFFSFSLFESDTIQWTVIH